jgi:RNA polymerase sigma-70 factor (ECF subfamily)
MAEPTVAVANPQQDAPQSCLVPPFLEVYSRYFDFVWATCRRMGVERESIDDVVQEIFLVIHQRLHTLAQPSSLQSWIYGIARRTVSNHRRAVRYKNASAVKLANEALPFEFRPQTPQDLSEQNDQVKLLEAVLSELSEMQREVFILAEIEEFSAPEIATALEIPLNTAYSRLRVARQAFEAALARREADARVKKP